MCGSVERAGGLPTRAVVTIVPMVGSDEIKGRVFRAAVRGARDELSKNEELRAQLRCSMESHERDLVKLDAVRTELARLHAELAELKQAAFDGVDVVELAIRIILREMNEDISKTSVRHAIIDRSTDDMSEVADMLTDVDGWVGARPQTLVRIITSLMERLIAHPKVNEERMVKRRKLNTALAIAAIYKGAHDHASFGFGKVVGLFVAAKTQSRRAVRLVSSVIPGAFSPSGLKRKFSEMSNLVASKLVPRKVNIVIGWNNVAKGDYGGDKHARLDGNEHIISVVSNRFCAVFKTPSGEKSPRYLQGELEHSPMLWKPLNKVPSDILVASSQVSGGDLSELDILQSSREVLASKCIRIAQIEYMDQVALSGSGTSTKRLFSRDESEGQVDDGDATAAAAAATGSKMNAVRKWCPVCKKTFALKAQTCDDCMGHVKLVSTAEAKAKAAYDSESVKTRFRTTTATPRWLNEEAPRSSVLSTGPNKKVIETYVTDVADRHTPEDDVSGASSGDRRIGSPMDEWIEYIPLPVEPYNPGLSCNKRALTDQALKDGNVRGFCEPDEPWVREWVMILNDLGAALTEVHCSERVHALMPLGHEEAMYIRACSKFMVVLLGKNFIMSSKLFGSEKIVEILSNGADLHRSFQFLKLVHRVVTSALVIEYAHEVKSSELDAKAFISWLEKPRNDEKFVLLESFFARKILPALFTYRDGCRCNDAKKISAARKVLLPFIAARGHANYMRAIIMDIVRVEFQCTPEVRELVERFRTYKGQGLDYKLEEANAVVKSFLTTNTENSWRIASTLACKAPFIFKGMFKWFKWPAESAPMSRSEPKLDAAAKLMVQRLIKSRALKPCPDDTARCPMSIFDQELLVTFDEVMKNGQEAIDEYMHKIQKVEGPRLARKISTQCHMTPLTVDERYKRDQDTRVGAKTKHLTDAELERALELRRPIDEEGRALANQADAEFENL